MVRTSSTLTAVKPTAASKAQVNLQHQQQLSAVYAWRVVLSSVGDVFTELPKVVGNRLRLYLGSLVRHSMAAEHLETLACSRISVLSIFHVSVRLGLAKATLVAMANAHQKVSQQQNRYDPKAPNDDSEVELIQAVNLAARTALNHLRILPKLRCSLVGAPDLASLLHEQGEPGVGVPAE